MSQGRQHSFATLFLSVDVIEIPIVQRDYAQGREQSTDVRLDFLMSLHEALRREDGPALDLDFVYGAFEDGAGKVLSLIDGQQRLTTLFLLHWYIAMCEGQLEDFRARWTRGGRSSFTYATRPSSTEFFDALANAVVAIPESEQTTARKLSERLIDSNWFFLSWRGDPTVKACLTTLDSISQVFGTTHGLYPLLINEQRPRITFHFLDLERFGLTDDLYIKMNARGKPLTPFENFKAWLVGRVANEPWAACFDLAMDQKWMDLFWRLAQKQTPAAAGSLFDDLFLRFMYVMAFFEACTRVERLYSAPKSTTEWIAKLRLARGHIPLRELESSNAFSPASVQLASVVLDHFCGPVSPTDLKTLEQALAPSSDHTDLVRLFALVAWLGSAAAVSGSSASATARARWDRVTSNLIANHRIDELAVAVLAVKGLESLSVHAGRLYEALAEAPELPTGFGLEQRREEARKARLILEDPARESLFIESEAHSYLQGRIGFLLDFSTRHDGSFDREAFERYSESARAVLAPAILASSAHLLERALLSIDDYLVERGSAKFSFCLADANTYRDRSENWLQVIVRPGFQMLLDRVSGDPVASLQTIIEQATCNDWRKHIVADPRLIDYCGERIIHRGESGGIYLLSRKRLSGYHAELHSYALHLALVSSKDSLPGMTHHYAEVYDDTQPALVLLANGEKLRVSHWTGSWSCEGATEEVPLPDGLARYIEEHGF